MIRLVGLWAPVAGFMAAVWFLSDDISLEIHGHFNDKALHFLAYGLFGLFNMRAFHGGFRRPAVWASVAALVLTGGFGALDEWRQSGMSFRDASWYDWVADVCGGVVAWTVFRLLVFEGERGTEFKGR